MVSAISKISGAETSLEFTPDIQKRAMASMPAWSRTKDIMGKTIDKITYLTSAGAYERSTRIFMYR